MCCDVLYTTTMYTIRYAGVTVKILDNQSGSIDFQFSSRDPRKWRLSRLGGDAPWMHLTLADRVSAGVVRSISTNDAELIKQVLEQPYEELVVRSFQAIFPCDFPDNQGLGVADIYQFSEGRTKLGVTFHTLHTRFGVYRIGGARDMKASEVLYDATVVLYAKERPKTRYFGG